MLNDIEKYNNFVLAAVNCNFGKEINSIYILFALKNEVGVVQFLNGFYLIFYLYINCI